MISFIVATYQRPDCLATLLWSIKAQTSKDWEVIVMDEGKNQDVVDIVNDPRIKRYAFERVELALTIPKAKNSPDLLKGCGSLGLLPKDAGVKYAKGEYLCFPSEDIYYTPVFIEEMLKDTENKDILMCNFLFNAPRDWSQINYTVFNAYPCLGRVDSCNYLIKPKVYLKYPFTRFMSDDKQLGWADGLVPETAVKEGASWKLIDKTLVVKN